MSSKIKPLHELTQEETFQVLLSFIKIKEAGMKAQVSYALSFKVDYLDVNVEVAESMEIIRENFINLNKLLLAKNNDSTSTD